MALAAAMGAMGVINSKLSEQRMYVNTFTPHCTRMVHPKLTDALCPVSCTVPAQQAWASHSVLPMCVILNFDILKNHKPDIIYRPWQKWTTSALKRHESASGKNVLPPCLVVLMLTHFTPLGLWTDMVL